MVEVRKNKRGENKEVRRNQTHNLPAGDKLLERQYERHRPEGGRQGGSGRPPHTGGVQVGYAGKFSVNRL